MTYTAAAREVLHRMPPIFLAALALTTVIRHVRYVRADGAGRERVERLLRVMAGCPISNVGRDSSGLLERPNLGESKQEKNDKRNEGDFGPSESHPSNKQEPALKKERGYLGDGCCETQ